MSAANAEVVEEPTQKLNSANVDVGEEPAKALNADEVEVVPESHSATDAEVVDEIYVAENGGNDESAIATAASFNLNKPSAEIETLRAKEAISESIDESDTTTEVQEATTEPTARSQQWKFEPEPGDDDYEEPAVTFTANKEDEEDMDMTPMVDVVFLLLIFFMVTASFTLQKSMQQPPSIEDEPSLNSVPDEEDKDEIIRVQIDEFNTYLVVTGDWEEEAPSSQDLRVLVRRAIQEGINGTTPTKMLVTAHGESYHEKVVTAMDVGASNDLAIQVSMTNVDF